MTVAAIPGVLYQPDFLADHAALFAWATAGVAWDERIKARKTASVGVPYDYAGLSYPPSPFPPELDRVRAAVSARLGFEANNCLLNFYPDGDARMGWHADAAMGLAPGTGVAIVSLGVERVLKFRRADRLEERVDLPLAPGSLCYLEARVQRDWQHALPRTRRHGARVSLTFRAVVGPRP